MLSFLSFIGFTLLVAGLAWYHTRDDNLSNSEGYYLAGRSLTGMFIAGSMMLTNLSTEHLIGLNGMAFSSGFIVMAWEVGSAFTIVLFAFYFLPKYLKMGIATIPDFLERRFDQDTLLITSLLFLGMYVISLLPIVLYTGAIAMESLFNVSAILNIEKATSLWLIVWIVGIIGSVYAIFGGLKAVAVSDTINGVGLLVGGIMVTLFGLSYVGDGSIIEGMSEVYNSNPEKFNSIGDTDSVVPFSTLFTGMFISNLFFWCTNQSIVQRALGAKNLKEGQKGVLLAAFFKLLGPLLIILPGIIAFHIFQDSVTVPDEAYPSLIQLVLPDVFVGFFAAVVMGSVLSTFNSALNSSVTLFSCNIYKTRINTKANDDQMVRMGKVIGLGLALAAMLVAPLVANAPDGLFYLIQQLQGIFNAPILSVVLVGLFTKRVPAIAAKIGLIFGMVAYIVGNFILDLNIHFFHLVGILFVLNVALMLIIGHFFPAQNAYEELYTHQVSIQPWEYVKHVGLAIVTASIGMYIFLAPNVPTTVLYAYYALLAFTIVYCLQAIVNSKTSNLSKTITEA